MIRIEGLEKLQRQLDQAQKAFAELDGELLKLSFDPNDATSVEAAIAELKLAIDRKAAPFKGKTSAHVPGHADRD